MAKQKVDHHDNRDNRNKSYSEVTSVKKAPLAENEKIKDLTNKIEALITLITNALPHLNVNILPNNWIENMNMEVGNANVDDIINPTPGQPTVQDAVGYYTADYNVHRIPSHADPTASHRGNNNPPPTYSRADRKRQSTETKKEEKNKKGKNLK